MAKPSTEDRIAIEDLLVRYTTSLDALDIEALVGCFVEDCLLESPVVGRYEGLAGIRRFAEDMARHARQHGGTFRHVVSNFRIDVEGDHGTARCYLLDFLTVGGRTELLSPGEYECELIKLAGEWRFKSRIVHMDHVFTLR
jgi:ketosteroid isomerase-like protein